LGPGAALIPDNGLIATASRDRTGKAFYARTKESIVVIGGHAEMVYSDAFSPVGRFAATGGGGDRVHIGLLEDEKPGRNRI
jgi:WD40 repeat protein